MAGLTSALNIAKNTLLNFQLATSVISHNVANVNNPSFSRQRAIETTYPPSPSPVGDIGLGSKVEKILRYFDIFLERNINLKKTDLGLFSASESALNILESLFNETQDSGLSKILREFWNAWQNLANYPENLSARTQVVESGKLIAEALKAKFQGMKDLEVQIGLKLKEMVDNINRLSSQIAELNLQIIARESGGRTANDLRDQRDRLVGELSQLANIQYFESKEGAYNIILGKGYNLVNLGTAWKLGISGLDVYWSDSQGAKVPLTSREVASGELGGWLKMLEQLSDSYNYEYVSSTKGIYLPLGRTLSESDTFGDLGILSGTINFTGKDHFGKNISGSFNITTGNTTLREFLYEIEKAFSFTVKAYIKDGRLYVEDAFRGPGKLEFSITSAPSALDFGTFDDPAYQRRVEELNLAGKLKLLGEELVKAVNELHTQGVGLEFFSKELEGAYSANLYIKELPYFLDLNRVGFFYLWVRKDQGEIRPVRVELNLSEDATLNDLASVINQALSQAGFNTGPNYDLRAIIRGGRLVFQAREGISFAFSNDTSGILLSTGINLFFHGTDPADLSINPLLVQRPEFISSGKMDVSALISQKPLFGIFRSDTPINVTQTFQVNTLYVRPYDEKAKAYIFPPQAFYEGTITGNVLGGPITIKFKDAAGNDLGSPLTIPAGTSWQDLLNILDGSKGIKATFEGNILRFEFTQSKAPVGALWFEVEEGVSGLMPLIRWDKTLSAYAISLDSADNLQTILSKLNRLPFFRAYIDEFGHMVMRLEPNQTNVYGFSLGEVFTGTDPNDPQQSFLSYMEAQKMYIPSFRWDGQSESAFLSGLEGIIGQAQGSLRFYLFDEKGKPLDTLEINLSNITNIFQILQAINSPENARYALSARLDREGRLIVETTGLYDTRSFIAMDTLPPNNGFFSYLNPYILKRGDNRIAQAIADSATETREKLNLSTLENYYASIVGEVGTVTKSVKESKSFLDDLLRQLSAIKDSISGVSLDEEMANLLKYQQAFIATTKVLSTVEDMFEALISAKR